MKVKPTPQTLCDVLQTIPEHFLRFDRVYYPAEINSCHQRTPTELPVDVRNVGVCKNSDMWKLKLRLYVSYVFSLQFSSQNYELWLG